jgi:hypothetical protein
MRSLLSSLAVVAFVSILAAGPAAAQPIASGELEPGLRVEVTRLQKLPGAEIVELRFDLVNETGKLWSLEKFGAATAYFITDIELLDLVNGVSYRQGTSGGDGLSSRFKDGGAVQPGERRSFWMWFKAPPAGVDRLALFVRGAPPILGVPVSR